MIDSGNIQVEVTEGAQNSGQYFPVTVKATSSRPADDNDGDNLIIDLDNASSISKNRNVFVTVKNCRNPPSLAPLEGFKFATSD